MEQIVLFDMKEESLLEPLAPDARKFRVTMYNPDLMFRTHGLGRHQYLVAREIIEADTVLNLPKLKTHKKACLTGALKNMIGVNGHKGIPAASPQGGSTAGGDCYEGSSFFKSCAENLLDAANRSQPGTRQTLLAKFAHMMLRFAMLEGQGSNLEGSWFGNDTVWRTCLDLQRIVRYGRLDGTIGVTPMRQVISITDALVGGEGEGPMMPTPVLAGYLTGAINPAAAEWAHARLMGFDPRRIPLLLAAFSNFSYPLTDFPPSEVLLRCKDSQVVEDEIFPVGGRAFTPAKGLKVIASLMPRAITELCGRLLWRRILRRTGRSWAELERFPALHPGEQRPQLADRLLAQLRYFAGRKDALPEWREAARITDPEELWWPHPSLPILNKATLRKHFEPQQMKLRFGLEGKLDSTGGSTGEPTHFLHDPEMIRA